MGRRLAPDERAKIPNLYREGLTIPKIAKVLGCGRTTVNRYVMDAFGVRQIKTRVRFNPCLEDQLGEFVGIFAGDGNVEINSKKFRYRLRISLNANERQYAEHIQQLSHNLFGKVPLRVLKSSMKK